MSSGERAREHVAHATRPPAGAGKLPAPRCQPRPDSAGRSPHGNPPHRRRPTAASAASRPPSRASAAGRHAAVVMYRKSAHGVARRSPPPGPASAGTRRPPFALADARGEGSAPPRPPSARGAARRGGSTRRCVVAMAAVGETFPVGGSGWPCRRAGGGSHPAPALR